jgi:hypothetical protein
MAIIDEPCPVCGGDIEETVIRSRALRPGGSGGRETIAYKCLSKPAIGHLPPNWKPPAE